MKALVTGASSGIGKSISLKILSYGYNLIAVSTNKKELDKIYCNYKDKVKCLEIDLRKREECFKLYEMVADDNIDILINNAGVGEYGLFKDTKLNKELDMINVNICAYHILTKLFLNDFIKRNYGRIVNVSSISSFMYGPNMATYYATKSYITSLSLAISYELKKINSNVKISVFTPGPVKTNFQKKANVKFNIKNITADDAANNLIKEMFKNKTLIIPNNMKLKKFLIRFIPNNLIMHINYKIVKKRC